MTGHRIAADPLGSFLDAVTIATLPFTEGASAGLEAGATSARAAGLARTANVLSKVGEAGDAMRAGRTLSYTDEAGKVHSAEFGGSPNPLTRGLQAIGDRVSAKLPAEVSSDSAIEAGPVLHGVTGDAGEPEGATS